MQNQLGGEKVKRARAFKKYLGDWTNQLSTIEVNFNQSDPITT